VKINSASGWFHSSKHKILRAHPQAVSKLGTCSSTAGAQFAITNQTISCNRVLLEKLIVLQIIKQFQVIYRHFRCINMLTGAHH
jgi:hypothetical protein